MNPSKRAIPSNHTRAADAHPRSSFAASSAFMQSRPGTAASATTVPGRRRSERIASRPDISPMHSARPKKRSREDADAPMTTRSRRKHSLKKPPPPASPDDSKPKAIVDGDMKPAAKTDESCTCTICMCEPEQHEIASVDGCEHLFCFSCIEKWSELENTCPNCKSRFCKIKRMHPQRRKGGSSSSRPRNSKTVKQRDQRSDRLPNVSLESFIANFASRLEGSRFSDPSARFRFLAVGGPRASGVISVPRMSTSGRAPSRQPVSGRISSSQRVIHYESGWMPPSFFGMSESGDDDDGFLDNLFMTTLMRHPSGFRRHPSGFRPVRRSHATNANDATAGRDSSNPLEISDDDDDDDVEVVHVSSSSSS